MAKEVKQFKVLIYKMGKIEYYDVLPYFRNCWKEKYNIEEKDKIKTSKQPSKRKELFKKWVQDRASYMFRARCEYEFLMASWPFGCRQMYDDLKCFLPVYNIGDWSHDIKFCNIITKSMEKIDVYDQIMMNISTIVDILYTEFNIDENYDKRRVAAQSSGNA
jgi:hypothetical protein